GCHEPRLQRGRARRRARARAGLEPPAGRHVPRRGTDGVRSGRDDDQLRWRSGALHDPGLAPRTGTEMNLSVFEIFKVGIGPSSSHTMGPMNAARAFVESLAAQGLLERTTSVTAELFGSLALTGRGHCTDRAILLGLEGMKPETIDSAQVEPTVERIRKAKRLRLRSEHEIAFDESSQLLFHHDKVLPGHSNGMQFTARDAAGLTLAHEEYYSTG